MLSFLLTMTDRSWVGNVLACSQKRFKQLLYETPASLMLDKGKNGQEYWDRLNREKETARKLNDLLFTYNLYENYDY